MQVLSVRQPLAWAIARGHAAVENRGWATSHRGVLAIHASMRVDLESAASPLVRAAHWDPDDPVAAIGGIVAVVRLSGVCAAAVSGQECDCGAWARPAAYHWQLADPQPLPRPVAEPGGPGLWELSPALADEVTRMLATAAVPPQPDQGPDATRQALSA